MKYEFQQGRALVLVGPEGCGKSTMAREIAKRCGPHIEIDVREFDSPFGFGRALRNEPKTVIVEGVPTTPKAQALVKLMLASDAVICEQQGRAPKTVKPPNFIFCTGSVDFLGKGNADRRFHVIRMGEHQKGGAA